MKRPPLFILGAPRSGTTLLYKALCLHPDVAYTSNWLRRALLSRPVPSTPAWAALNRLPPLMPRRRRRAWFGSDGNAYVYGRRRDMLDRITPMPVEGEPLFARFGFGLRDANPSRPAALAAYCERLVRFGGGHVMVSKRIDHNRRASLLVEAFPDARFVVVSRDGRAVAASLARVDWWPTTDLWWADTTPAAWAAAGRDPWEACARHWVEEVRAIDRSLADVDESRVLRVGYEAIVGRASLAIGEVARFGGLDDDTLWLDEIDSLAYDRPDRGWSRDLDADARATIEEVAGPELRRRRYVAA